MPGSEMSECAQVAVLHVGVSLGTYARKQRRREAPHVRAFVFIDACSGNEHAQVSLQPFLNGLLQRQAVRRLLGGAEGISAQAGQR